MAKKAFVIGANSKKLDYAESDAKKISRALRNLGYEVDGLTTDTEESYQVVQRFRKFAATCKQYDTLIFYFAGHGVSHNNTLYLALNSSKFDDITSSAIPITDITTTLNSATAQNRLIILDCCEASSENLVIGNAENYQVLRATEKWQRASEFEELKAGFLSFHLHKLLTEPVARHLLNENHGLTFNTLLQELRKQVQQHNQKYPDKIVPKFVREGKDNNDYEIATLTPQYAGLLAITPQFIEQERNKHSSNPHLYSCEQFYGANPQAQWWGIINGLVAERAIYADIKAHIHKALSKPINKPIITLVLGSGGMGKSTFLRQLAVDLAQDYKVFWLQDWTSFEAESIADNLAQDSAYQLICLDNWHRLADEDKKSIKKWLEQHSELHSKIKWLLSDREEAKELSNFIYGKSCFDFDDIQNTAKAQDNKFLLTKVAEKMTTWKETALELQNHTIANAKPFQILFVLYRWAGREEKIDFEDFETSFHKIIEDDIERLRRDKQIAGFSNALIDFAYIFINYKTLLTKNTFLRLADYHNHDNEKIALFSNYEHSVPDDEVWGLLRYYLTICGITSETNGQDTILNFTKEDLAEAIIQKYAKEFKLRKKAVCTFCVKDNSKFSASNLLGSAAIQGIFNSKETIDLVHELLEKGNFHPNYIMMIITKNSPIKFDNPKELIEIIEQFIAINPHHYIIYAYLELLDKKMAQQKASELLAVENQNPHVITKCFDILGKTPETQQKASELLAVENQNPHVIAKCFDILGKTVETQQQALILLKNWQTMNSFLVRKCIFVASHTKEVKAIVTQIISDKRQEHSYLYQLILALPLKHIPRWQTETEKVLRYGKNKILVHACVVSGNHQNLALMRQPCVEILENWQTDIATQRASRNNYIHTFHIVKALAYPAKDALYKMAVRNKAQAMLDKEAQDAGFLGDILYEAAYNIVHHQQYPAWIPEEDI